MSQADELLQTLTGNNANARLMNPELEEHIIIDENRYITVPDSLKRIAVRYDHAAETVTFDCPRYWDGVDLSVMEIAINYMRADGKTGTFITNEVRIDEIDSSIMHFDWTIYNFTTEIKGKLNFLVCARLDDEDGNEIYHWNTELNDEMYISEGLESSETIKLTHPDIFTQLLQRMDEYETITESHMNTAKSYAVGTDGEYREGDATDNAKYYSEYANERAKAAAKSEENSKTSETNAKTSETNSKTSETNAKTSETNAKTLEEATRTSAKNAADSELNAKTSETNAKTSETNAKKSEDNAAAMVKDTTDKIADGRLRGSRWSSGLAITGTDEVGTVFPLSGINDAIVNDHYLNIRTNNMYRCIKTGDAGTAQWAYIGNIAEADMNVGLQTNELKPYWDIVDTFPEDIAVKSVMFVNNMFMVSGMRETEYGNIPVIYISDDGILWIPGTVEEVQYEGIGAIKDVAYDGEKYYVGISDDAIFVTSLGDETEWKAVHTLWGVKLISVVYVDGMFIIIDEEGILHSSEEPSYGFSTMFISNIDITPSSMIYAESKLIVIADVLGQPSVFFTEDYRNTGDVWTQMDDVTRGFTDITYGNNMFVVISGLNSGCSKDGVTWSYKEDVFESVMNDIVYDGKYFVAVGENNSMYISTDGINWTSGPNEHLNGEINCNLLKLAYGRNRFIVTGDDEKLHYINYIENVMAVEEVVNKMYNDKAADDLTVSLVTDEWDHFIKTADLPGTTNIKYLNGLYFAIRDPLLYYSTDGVDWQECIGINNVKDLTYGSYMSTTITFSDGTVGNVNGRFIAIASGGAIYGSWDGIVWEKIATSTFSGTNIVYARGSYTYGIFVVYKTGYGSMMCSTDYGATWRQSSPICYYGDGGSAGIGINKIVSYQNNSFYVISKMTYNKRVTISMGNGQTTTQLTSVTSDAIFSVGTSNAYSGSGWSPSKVFESSITLADVFTHNNERFVITTQGDTYQYKKIDDVWQWSQTTSLNTSVPSSVVSSKYTKYHIVCNDTDIYTLNDNGAWPSKPLITTHYTIKALCCTDDIIIAASDTSIYCMKRNTKDFLVKELLTQHGDDIDILSKRCDDLDKEMTVELNALNDNIDEIVNDRFSVNTLTNEPGEILHSDENVGVKVFGNGIFVTDKGYYSYDGLTWYRSSSFGSSAIDIVFGNNRFVALVSSSTIKYSLDGISWSTVSNSYGSNGLLYSNGKFVIVKLVGSYGADHTITSHYSTDGVTWTAGTSLTLPAAATIPSKSSAGIAFSYIRMTNDSSLMISAFSGNGKYFVCVYRYSVWQGTFYLPQTMPNGQTTSVPVSEGGSGYYYKLYCSSNGTTWSLVYTYAAGKSPLLSVYGNSKYVTFLEEGSMLISTNTTTWTATTYKDGSNANAVMNFITDTRSLQSCVFLHDRFYASTYDSSTDEHVVWMSTDAVTWYPKFTIPLSSHAYSQGIKNILYGNNIYIFETLKPESFGYTYLCNNVVSESLYLDNHLGRYGLNTSADKYPGTFIPLSTIVSSGSITIANTSDQATFFHLDNDAIYALFTKEITISNGTIYGYRMMIIYTSRNTSTGFPLSNRVQINGSSNAGVTITDYRTEETFGISIKPSAVAYRVDYVLMRLM